MKFEKEVVLVGTSIDILIFNTDNNRSERTLQVFKNSGIDEKQPFYCADKNAILTLKLRAHVCLVTVKTWTTVVMSVINDSAILVNFQNGNSFIGSDNQITEIIGIERIKYVGVKILVTLDE